MLNSRTSLESTGRCRFRDNKSIHRHPALRQHHSGLSRQKKSRAEARDFQAKNDVEKRNDSGAEAGGFNQANLITSGREFSSLIALNDHPTT